MSTSSYVNIPDDTSNVGKKVRVNQRSVGGNTVYEHFVAPIDFRDILGVYCAHTGLLTIQQNPSAANTGFLYIFNPSDSTVLMAMRRVYYQGTPTSTSARPALRLTVERFTFTGTFTGSDLPSCRVDSTQPAAQGISSLNSTGLSVTASGITPRGFLVPAVPSGNNTTGNSNEMVWEPNSIEEETVIRPGEGLLFKQADAGASGDDRVFLFDISWAEY